jgi:hypothetical protein
MRILRLIFGLYGSFADESANSATFELVFLELGTIVFCLLTLALKDGFLGSLDQDKRKER